MVALPTTLAVLGRSRVFKNDAIRQLEFFRKSIDKFLNFFNISANLCDDLSLLVNFLLCELKHSEVFIPKLKSVLLFMGHLLKLNHQFFVFKRNFFKLSRLLFNLAVLPFWDDLMRSNFMIEVFNPS